MPFVDLLFLLGLSEGACLCSMSRSDPHFPDLCLLSYSTVSLFALACSWPCRDSLDLSAGTASSLDPARDCSGPSIITSSGSNASLLSESSHGGWFPTTIFEQFPIGVIPGANPHTVLGSDHAPLDANDYHGIRVIQRFQAVFSFLLAQHRVPDFNFHHGCVSVCLLLSAYCFIFCFCSRSRQRIIVPSLYLWPLKGGPLSDLISFGTTYVSNTLLNVGIVAFSLVDPTNWTTGYLAYWQ